MQHMEQGQPGQQAQQHYYQQQAPYQGGRVQEVIDTGHMAASRAPRQAAGQPMAHMGSPRTERIMATHQNDLTIPAYLRKAKKGGPDNQSIAQFKQHTPGSEDFVFDEEEFEVPAFIRMQAD